MNEPTSPRCDEPHPYLPDIRCDYHKGHQPLDAWPALNNPDQRRTVYDHGNSVVRRWWVIDGVST